MSHGGLRGSVVEVQERFREQVEDRANSAIGVNLTMAGQPRVEGKGDQIGQDAHHARVSITHDVHHDAYPRTARDERPLHRLTGGNPREVRCAEMQPKLGKRVDEYIGMIEREEVPSRQLFQASRVVPLCIGLLGNSLARE